MDYKLEVVAVPVNDVDAAKAFYERIGYHIDQDHRVSDELRFVQITPPDRAARSSSATASPRRRRAPHRDSRSSSTTSRPHKRSCATPASRSETSSMP
jgi:hypothetical protein